MTETYLSGLHSAEARRALAEVLLVLFRNWGIHELNQAQLLGMAEVKSLWEGAALPNTTSVLERAGMLLAIDRMLKQQFVEEPLMRDRWVEFPNAALDGNSPLQVMLEGAEGIRRVHALLERQMRH
jgi:hypothetical protein